MLIYKTCKECKISKQIHEFVKGKDWKYGVRTVCKSCMAKYNADPINRARKKVLNNTPEAKEKRRLAFQEWRAKRRVDKFIDKFLEGLQ